MEILSVFVGFVGLLMSFLLILYTKAPKSVLQIVRGKWKNEWEVPQTLSLWEVSWVPAVAGVSLAFVMPTTGFEWSLRLFPFVGIPPLTFLVCLLYAKQRTRCEQWSDLILLMTVFNVVVCVVVTCLTIRLRGIGAFILTVVNVCVIITAIWFSYKHVLTSASEEARLNGGKLLNTMFDVYVPVQIVLVCLVLFLSRWFWLV